MSSMRFQCSHREAEQPRGYIGRPGLKIGRKGVGAFIPGLPESVCRNAVEMHTFVNSFFEQR